MRDDSRPHLHLVNITAYVHQRAIPLIFEWYSAHPKDDLPTNETRPLLDLVGFVGGCFHGANGLPEGEYQCIARTLEFLLGLRRKYGLDQDHVVQLLDCALGAVKRFEELVTGNMEHEPVRVGKLSRMNTGLEEVSFEGDKNDAERDLQDLLTLLLQALRDSNGGNSGSF